MHRGPAQHRAIRRSNAQLDARDPSLINLPLPVNSIPVLGPVLSPLIGDNDGGNKPQPAASQNPNPNPNPSPDPNPSPTPTSLAAGGNNGGNGGNTNGNGGGDTSTPTTPPAILASGGGPAIPPSRVPNPTPPASSPGKSSPTDINNGNGNSNVSSGVFIPNGNSPGASGGGNTAVVVENVANPASPTNLAGLGGSNSDTLTTTGVLAPSQSLLRSGSHTAGATSPQSTGSESSDTGASSGKLLSGGAIAGIVILCLLFFLALILFIIRRRSITRRVELRKQWFGRSGSVGLGRLSVLNITARRSHLDPDGELDRRSTRSSFATTYDQGLACGTGYPQWHSVGTVPGLPPMAQVRERSSVLMSTGGAAARRESLNSMLSNGSDPDAQYLICSADLHISDLPSPMSVRPFSPSESFSFPKPPAPPTGNADSLCIGSLRSSTTTLVNLATPSRALTTPPIQPQALIPGVAISPSIVATKNYTINPFADPMKSDVTDVEVIRRSFEPSLDDELAVRPGDHVHVLRVFDDGWAFVDKFARTKMERSEQGLIPIDCLSDSDQTPPVFFAL